MADVETNVGITPVGLLGHTVGSPGSPGKVTPAQAKTLLAIVPADVAGLGTMAQQNATAVAITGGTITGMPNPSASTDVVNKAYADAIAAGQALKGNVAAATTVNITLSGPQTVDGVAITTQRVLVKNQTTQSQNGLYDGNAGAWTRTTDADTYLELVSAAGVRASTFVIGGTQANTGWACTAAIGGTLGSTAITWEQNAATGGMQSFNGRTGVVVSATNDYSATQVSNTPAGTIAATTVQAALNELDVEKVPTTTTLTAGAGLTGGGTLAANRTFAVDIAGQTTDATPDGTADFVMTYDASATALKKVLLNNLATGVAGVASFNGRTGAVAPAASDYTATQVVNTPAGAIAATTVQAALNELDAEKVNITTTVTAGAGLTGGGTLAANRLFAVDIAGQAIDPTPDPVADYVMSYDASAGGLKRVLINALAPVGVASFNTRTGAVAPAAADYTATQITNVPAGTIAAATVQAALNELDVDKVATTVAVTAGAGLTGGGTLTADRSLAVDIVGQTIDATPDLAADYVMSYDASAAGLKRVLINNLAPVTSFNTRTGAIAPVAADYNAAQITNTPAGTIAATTVQAALNELDGEKVPTTRTITAGEGLTGTGDLSANRTLAMNVSGLTADTAPDVVNDFVLTYDTSATAHKKVALTNLPSAAGNVANVPAGTIAATTVQAALNELDAEKVPVTTTISTATGLSGGGSLAANRTIALDVNSLTSDTAPSRTADFILGYATGAAAHRKIPYANIPITAANLPIVAGTNVTAALDAPNNQLVISASGTISGGVTTTPDVKIAAYTAVSNQRVLTNTTASAFTVTLPAAPVNGDLVIVVDTFNKWALNNLTVGRNGKTINGIAANYVLTGGREQQFLYNGTAGDWEPSATVAFPTLKDYGALGNGVADDTVAIQAATATGITVYAPPGTYIVNSSVAIHRNCNIIGAGSNLVLFDFSAATLSSDCVGSTGASTAALPALASTHTIGQRQINFASSHGLAVGEAIVISVPAAGSYLSGSANWCRGEIGYVTLLGTGSPVPLNSVEISRGLQDTYTAAEVSNYVLRNPATNRLSGFSIKGNPTVQRGGLGISRFHGVQLSDVKVYNTHYYATVLTEGCWGYVDGCNFSNDVPDAGTGNSYGLALSGVQDVEVSNCRLYGDRHGLTHGSGGTTVKIVNRWTTVHHCDIDSNIQLCFDWHPIVENCTVDSCNLHNGVSVGGNKWTLKNCRIGMRGTGTPTPAPTPHVGSWYAKGGDCIIEGNTFVCDFPMAFAVISLGSYDAETVHPGTITIRNNNIDYNQRVASRGTTQTGGSTTTIKLAAGASSTDSFYNGFPIRITEGTNTGYVGWITAYVGSTRIATVSVAAPAAWNDATTIYEIGSNNVGGVGLVNLSMATDTKIDVDIDGWKSNYWAPNKDSPAIHIAASGGKKWGDVRISNCELVGPLYIEHVVNSLRLSNVDFNGSEYVGPITILVAPTRDIIANNVSIKWARFRGVNITGSSALRVIFRDLMIDQCSGDANPSFQIDAAAYCEVLGSISNTRGGAWAFQQVTSTVAELYLGAHLVPANVSLLGTVTKFYVASLGGNLVTRGTAAPTTGTWAVGDRMIKTNMAAGASTGWICTTAGTPGTWTATAINS